MLLFAAIAICMIVTAFMMELIARQYEPRPSDHAPIVEGALAVMTLFALFAASSLR